MSHLPLLAGSRVWWHKTYSKSIDAITLISISGNVTMQSATCMQLVFECAILTFRYEFYTINFVVSAHWVCPYVWICLSFGLQCRRQYQLTWLFICFSSVSIYYLFRWLLRSPSSPFNLWNFSARSQLQAQYHSLVGLSRTFNPVLLSHSERWVHNFDTKEPYSYHCRYNHHGMPSTVSCIQTFCLYIDCLYRSLLHYKRLRNRH